MQSLSSDLYQTDCTLTCQTSLNHAVSFVHVRKLAKSSLPNLMILCFTEWCTILPSAMEKDVGNWWICYCHFVMCMSTCLRCYIYQAHMTKHGFIRSGYLICKNIKLFHMYGIEWWTIILIIFFLSFCSFIVLWSLLKQ